MMGVVPVNLVRKIEFDNLTWLNIINPTKADIEFLRQQYGFHPLVLEDCLSDVQRSKMDDYEEYLFLVLHFPRYHKDTLRLSSSEVDIFVGQRYLITLHAGELKPLERFFTACEQHPVERLTYMSKGSGFLLYEIISRLFDYCFPILDKIGFNLDSIERLVFSNRSQKLVEDISRTQLEIINYRRMIKPLRPVIMALERKNNKFLTENLEVYFDDITDQIEKIWNMLENFKEVVESIRATHESSISNRINNLMKIFTVISVIIQPMLLVSGLFSMNLKGIPFSDMPNSFWIIIGVSSMPTLIIATALFMKRREWL